MISLYISECLKSGAIQGNNMDYYDPLRFEPPNERFGAKRSNVYGCIEWCEEFEGCGGFSYYPTYVRDTAFPGACHLKRKISGSYKYLTKWIANNDTISGEVSCTSRLKRILTRETGIYTCIL